MRILLVVYDNDSYVSQFPLGLAYVATVWRERGHDVQVYSQDIYHWPESHLLNLLNNEHFDIVAVSVIGGYYQYSKLLKISKAINNSRQRPFYLLGGHGPAPEPEYFMRKTSADVIVMGEGEVTALEIIEALEGDRSLASVRGIAYNDNGKCVINPPRELIKNLDEIGFPAWDLFPMDHYLLRKMSGAKNNNRTLILLAGRGCDFKCNFCYRMDKGLRLRSVENIVEEMVLLNKKYNVLNFSFRDELTMCSEERITAIAEGILRTGLDCKWECMGRLNYAKPDVLKLMAKAGCVYVNYGIESLDQQALNVMNKGLTVKMIHEGIQNTLAAGISPGINVIFGNIGETRESLKLGVDFLLKYSDAVELRTIRPVTAYPGSPLYYYAIEKGLLKDCEDFYENKHVNSDLVAVNFTDLSDDEFHEALFDANRILIEDYFEKICARNIATAHKLYRERDRTFRGFRQE
ncbi:MAG: radical SAM protein [Deltaproteobacteria bacterium]|nr:radical SAM protein [Deltaproteobacteria bacterium]